MTINKIEKYEVNGKLYNTLDEAVAANDDNQGKTANQEIAAAIAPVILEFIKLSPATGNLVELVNRPDIRAAIIKAANAIPEWDEDEVDEDETPSTYKSDKPFDLPAFLDLIGNGTEGSDLASRIAKSLRNVHDPKSPETVKSLVQAFFEKS